VSPIFDEEPEFLHFMASPAPPERIVGDKADDAMGMMPNWRTVA